jgi:hypothetical protein
MKNWVRQHIPWILFAGLVILLIANARLFLPRFVLQKQKITVSDLHNQAREMVSVANDSADWATKVSNDEIKDASASNKELAAYQLRADDVVVKLQHAPFEVSMRDKVQQYLQLAQVLSFTLHDLGFSLADHLRVSRTAQVLRQAGVSASTL